MVGYYAFYAKSIEQKNNNLYEFLMGFNGLQQHIS